MNKNILKEKNLVLPSFILEFVKKLNLELNDFLLLIYFWNFNDNGFDVKKISKTLKISEQEILISFNILLSKKIISFDTIKDVNGKIIETVNLENFYIMLDEGFQEEKKEQEKEDIYSIFQSEFGRPISEMEYEIIRAWLEKGFSEELILGALKEAVYNGVNNLRYIDKILYEWQRKGYKTVKEATNQNNREINNTPKELFDYNWLDDNE